MNQPLFTILLPVHRPPALLPCAIESVLAQESPAFELFIICDGAPPETADCARQFAAFDSRIRAFVFPKGERSGEAWRHLALDQARGSLVCQIADDDLWLPQHLTEMRHLLERFEFGNLTHIGVLPDGSLRARLSNLADPDSRQRMLTERFNLFGPTAAGYRLETYRRLPIGWAPAPPDIWTDLYMWRKFLALDPLAAGTRHVITSLQFATPERPTMPLAQRAAESRLWLGRIGDPAARDAMIQQAWAGVADELRRRRALVLELRRKNEELRRRASTLADKLASLKQRLKWKDSPPDAAPEETLQRDPEQAIP